MLVKDAYKTCLIISYPIIDYRKSQQYMNPYLTIGRYRNCSAAGSHQRSVVMAEFRRQIGQLTKIAQRLMNHIAGNSGYLFGIAIHFGLDVSERALLLCNHDWLIELGNSVVDRFQYPTHKAGLGRGTLQCLYKVVLPQKQEVPLRKLSTVLFDIRNSHSYVWRFTVTFPHERSATRTQQ